VRKSAVNVLFWYHSVVPYACGVRFKPATFCLVKTRISPIPAGGTFSPAISRTRASAITQPEWTGLKPTSAMLLVPLLIRCRPAVDLL
jgi:hypothetical protein